MRRTVAVLLPFLSIFITCFAVEENQTDWSGGWSVSGPVTDWDSSFLSYDRTDYSSTGAISLSQMPEYFEIDTTTSIYRIQVDFDLDGDIDFVSGYPGYDFYWLENSNSGSAWIRHTIDLGTSGYELSDLALADIDSDNDLDFIFVWDKFSAEVVWFENINDDSRDSWEMHIIDPNGYPSRFKMADVDLDGDLDILGTTSKVGDYDSVAWWENFSQGSSWSKYEIDDDLYYGTSEVAVSDILGNGYPELVCNRRITGSSQFELVMYKTIGLEWDEVLVSPNSASYKISSGDVNSDGLDDIITYEGGIGDENQLAWYSFTASSNSWEQHVIYSENSDWSLQLCISDLDGDGDNDILALRGGTMALPDVSGIKWWENNGTGLLWNKHNIVSGFSGVRINSADINLDGNLDLITDIFFPFSADWVGLKWWDLTAENGYYDEGELISSILDTGEEPSWQYIDWNTAAIPLCSVEFQVRGGSTSDDLGEWSPSITAPMASLESYLDDGDRYIQYKAVLSTDNELLTPVLQDVSFHYWPVALDENQVAEIADCKLYVSESNPSYSNTVSMSFSIPVSAHVQLDVFDVSGRMIQRLANAEFTSGEHSIQASDLFAGIYLCRLQSSNYSDSIRFVILD